LPVRALAVDLTSNPAGDAGRDNARGRGAYAVVVLLVSPLAFGGALPSWPSTLRARRDLR
jgi:hypothetical protein